MKIKHDDINSKIYNIRAMQVMLDSDLASLYEIDTKVFNQAVKRNISRFPSHYRFQLTKEEYTNLRSQFVTLSLEHGKHTKYLPYVFTEHGVSMLSAVLKSKIAIDISIKIIDSFVTMKSFLSSNNELFKRLDNIEIKQTRYELKSNEKFDKLFDAIESKSIKPKQGIFYNGQIFDAYSFVADLIRDAKSNIVLIDNYIDDSVLTLFSKNQDIEVTLYTKTVSKQLKLDLQKYNLQYKNIKIKTFKDSHDRFMIIDNKEIYHIGASLKDLGKKWFAFSKFDVDSFDLLERLRKL